MASFRKRGSGWQVQVRRLGQKPISRTFRTKRDAEAWALRTEAVSLEGSTSVEREPVRANIRLIDALCRYRDEISTNKRGAIPEKYRIGKMMERPISRKLLRQITAHDVATYRDKRLTEVSSDSVRKELQLVRHVFELAKTEWDLGIERNPVTEIRIPPPGAPRVRRLSREEAAAIAEALKSTRNGVVGYVVRFALMTGMRRSEILRASWNHVNWEESTLLIPLTKNGHPRIVPLSQSAITLLGKLRDENLDPERIFPISQNAFRLSWERLRKRAGVKNLRFHDLRHEAISGFFEKGLSLPEVAMISGHRDPRQLMRYTHLDAIRIARKLQNGDGNDLEI